MKIKLSYSNVMATVAVFLALGGGAYAAAKLKQNSVKSKHIAPDAATGADVNESSLGKVPSAGSADSAGSATTAASAASVGGISVTPVSIALADPGATSPEIVNVGGSLVRVICAAGGTQVEVERGASGPPITGTWIRDEGAAPLIAHPSPGGGASPGAQALQELTATIREASGRVTRVTVDSFYETDAYGGSEDCFVQGTVERFG